MKKKSITQFINNTLEVARLMLLRTIVEYSYKISENNEIHEVIDENGIYKMRPVKESIVIMPGEKLKLKPKSYHIMFINLKRNLINKEMLEARLIFNKGLKIDIMFKVVIGQDSEKNH